MICHTILNILAALIRNAFQRGHQCVRLEKAPEPYDWEWNCSCGALSSRFTTELAAIDSFKHHTQRTFK